MSRMPRSRLDPRLHQSCMGADETAGRSDKPEEGRERGGEPEEGKTWAKSVDGRWVMRRNLPMTNRPT